jgi:hypothetical protein
MERFVRYHPVRVTSNQKLFISLGANEIGYTYTVNMAVTGFYLTDLRIY